ncbi:pyridoxamine 5'-phosphate oxidase family protein [Actinacidiphila glaucinigra]|uniref:pyridoxamine 5'-phosphate oxidase family protein n=1 Tax=Actinacidiphila glaucinigra TaxID=235986 RepID=UPI0037CC8FB6
MDTPDGLAVLPVDYTVAEGVIAFRTSAGATPAAAADTRCAFEVDHVDEAPARAGACSSAASPPP